MDALKTGRSFLEEALALFIWFLDFREDQPRTSSEHFQFVPFHGAWEATAVELLPAFVKTFR